MEINIHLKERQQDNEAAQTTITTSPQKENQNRLETLSNKTKQK